MATITKRNDTYKITVSCGYDGTGKQIRRHMTWKPAPGMTARQIEKELQKQALKFEETCSGVSQNGNIKLDTFLPMWFDEYAAVQLKERTIQRYRGLSVRVLQALGHLRIDKITPRQIQQFINNLGEDGINEVTGGKLSPKTIRHYWEFLSTVLEYAVHMEMIPSNPCSKVILPALEEKEHPCYTLDEAQKFLSLLEQESLDRQAFFTLAIYGGFRRAELLGLEWKDIDFQTGLVNIVRNSLYTKEKGVYTDTPKTKKSRRCLKLPQEVIEILKSYKLEQYDRRLKCGDQWVNTDRLFTKWNGEPMNPGTPYDWAKSFCKKNQLPFYGIHGFRHLNASLLITSGVDVRTVSASLGHSNTSTTLNIYAHTFAEAQAKASEAISEALNLKKEKHA